MCIYTHTSLYVGYMFFPRETAAVKSVFTFGKELEEWVLLYFH